MEDTLSRKIKKIRELKGYSQEYLAGKLDISQRAYSKIENGETRLHWDRMTQITKILDIDPIDMINFDDSLVFHHCTQSGKFGDVYNNFPKEMKELYESRISHLEEEVSFLRKQLEGVSK